jgi:putative DNA primase/helicase
MRRDLESEFEPFLPGVLYWVLLMPEAEVIEYLQNTDAKAPSLRGFQADILLETNPIALWADTALVISPGRKTFVGNKGMDSGLDVARAFGSDVLAATNRVAVVRVTGVLPPRDLP